MPFHNTIRPWGFSGCGEWNDVHLFTHVNEVGISKFSTVVIQEFLGRSVHSNPNSEYRFDNSLFFLIRTKQAADSLVHISMR